MHIMPATSTAAVENIESRPSRLLFDEEDSSSDISQSGNDNGPRRRCSFVSARSSDAVMDLRYPNSVNASDKSYDLSISSYDSLNTMQADNNDLEKIGMFEVAPSAAFPREGEGALKRVNSNPGMSSKDCLLHKLRLKMHTLEHDGMCNNSSVRLTGSGATKKMFLASSRRTTRLLRKVLDFFVVSKQ